MSHSFYFAMTPYHVLLALADAERLHARATVFFWGAFGAAPEVFAALQSQPPLLPDMQVEGVIGPNKSPSLRQAGRKAIETSLARLDVDRVVVFNDKEVLSQVILGWASRRPGVRTVCLEDGSTFYNDFTPAQKPLRTIWRRRLSGIRGFSNVRVLGTHPFVQEIRVLRPDLVRAELQGRVLPLDVDLLHSPVLLEFAQRLLHQFRRSGISDGVPACPELLLMPPLRNVDDWASCAKPFMKSSANTAYKHHPRQSEPDPGGLRRRARELPRGLPLEVLYLLWRRTPAAVVGDGGSTALMSTRLFDASARIVGVCVGGLPAYAAAFQRLGIEFL